MGTGNCGLLATRLSTAGDPSIGLRSEHESVNRQCSHCGEDVPTEEWHPVATARDDDGDVDIYAFCDEACRSAWKRERGS